MRDIIFIIVLLLISFQIHAQNIIISGEVLDKKTNEALPYVNIGVEGTVTGTITDLDGNFKLEIPQKHKSGVFVVSSVGYKVQKFSVSEYSGKQDLKVALQPIDYQIEEIKVVDKSLFPYKILKNASDYVNLNYISKPLNYTIYYKESGDIFKSREMIIEYFDKTGYTRSTTLAAFKSRNYIFKEVNRDFLVRGYKEGYVNIDDLLDFDLVRSNQNLLDKHHVRDFDVDIKEEKVIHGDSVWVLSYTCTEPDLLNTGYENPKKYKGEIIVTKGNFVVLENHVTIITTDYTLTGRDIIAENNGVKAEFTYSTYYKKYSKSYILDRIERKIRITKSDNTIKNSESVFIVTNFKNDYPNEISGRMYYDNLDIDKSFWASYNAPR